MIMFSVGGAYFVAGCYPEGSRTSKESYVNNNGGAKAKDVNENQLPRGQSTAAARTTLRPLGKETLTLGEGEVSGHVEL